MARPSRRIVLFTAALVLASVWWLARPGVGPGDGEREDFVAVLREAFADGRSGVWVEGHGRVVRQLPDDREGDRHQRFVLELPEGQTVLVSHNIDLAPRVEGLREGARVRFRGRYEWNREGGVIHWTHHDPDGRGAGGWIETGGERVR